MLFVLGLSLSSFVGTADAPMPAGEKHKQYNMMINALVPANSIEIVQRVLVSPLDEEHLCCWVGVFCAGTIIQRLLLEETREFQIKLDIRWLPPTLELLHLNAIYLMERLPLKHLPRELRYIGLIGCQCSIDDFIKPNQLILQHVPGHLEELHILDGWFIGVISLFGLPESMRIIQVSNTALKTIFVDFQDFPESMQCAGFRQSPKTKPKLVRVGKAKAPICFDLDHEFNLKLSGYIHTVFRLERDVIARVR